MIINGVPLLMAAPIVEMFTTKIQAVPTSFGLTECGYDIRIRETVRFSRTGEGVPMHSCLDPDGHRDMFVPKWNRGNFVLASSMEEFDMPNDLMGQVLNKSTWARQGLDASMTTNIEPGWKGTLTLELTYHGQGDLLIPAGSGIAQVMFHEIKVPAQYKGKYQNQEARPVEAK